MFKIVIALIITGILFSHVSTATTSNFYTYEKKELQDQHIIHIVKIPSQGYRAEIVKAKDGTGRETVPSIAQRSNASVAINGGFFKIGMGQDGKPSGTLVIQGKRYNLNSSIQSLIIVKSGVISLDISSPQPYLQDDISLLSGIPMLVHKKAIVKELLQKESGFYSQPHARTALGIDAQGTIIIVVAEHYYLQDLTDLTLDEMQSFLKAKGEVIAAKYYGKQLKDITLGELKQLLQKELINQHTAGSWGLSILELAQLMKNLGCEYAINLDGGGSSTLWIEGKVVNKTFGDKDEGDKTQVIRPVSDAILFVKRPTRDTSQH